MVGLAWAPDGALWLADAGNGRYARPGPDGGLETVRRPVPMYDLPWLGGWDEQGSFYDEAAVATDAHVRSVLPRVASPGVPVDTLILPAAKLPVPRLGQISFPLPFAPRQIFAFDRSGQDLGRPRSEYRLAALDLKGDTVMVVERPRQAAARRRAVAGRGGGPVGRAGHADRVRGGRPRRRADRPAGRGGDRRADVVLRHPEGVSRVPFLPRPIRLGRRARPLATSRNTGSR